MVVLQWFRVMGLSKVTETFSGASWSRLELKSFEGSGFKIIDFLNLATQSRREIISCEGLGVS